MCGCYWMIWLTLPLAYFQLFYVNSHIDSWRWRMWARMRGYGEKYSCQRVVLEGRKSIGRQARDVINMRSTSLLSLTCSVTQPDITPSNFISSELLPALASYYLPYFYFDFLRAPFYILWLSTRTTLVSCFPHILPCQNIADPCFSSR